MFFLHLYQDFFGFRSLFGPFVVGTSRAAIFVFYLFSDFARLFFYLSLFSYNFSFCLNHLILSLFSEGFRRFVFLYRFSHLWLILSPLDRPCFP